MTQEEWMREFERLNGRPATAEELASVFGSAYDQPLDQGPVKSGLKKAWIIGGLSALLVLLAAIGGFFWWQSSRNSLPGTWSVEVTDIVREDGRLDQSFDRAYFELEIGEDNRVAAYAVSEIKKGQEESVYSYNSVSDEDGLASKISGYSGKYNRSNKQMAFQIFEGKVDASKKVMVLKSDNTLFDGQEVPYEVKDGQLIIELAYFSDRDNKPIPLHLKK